jgi:hypothetical protein
VGALLLLSVCTAALRSDRHLLRMSCCHLQLLQLAAHLRRQGLFVATELTMPFDFEGRRKLEEADALVEALSGVAQLTVS